MPVPPAASFKKDIYLPGGFAAVTGIPLDPARPALHFRISLPLFVTWTRREIDSPGRTTPKSIRIGSTSSRDADANSERRTWKKTVLVPDGNENRNDSRKTPTDASRWKIAYCPPPSRRSSNEQFRIFPGPLSFRKVRLILTGSGFSPTVPDSLPLFHRYPPLRPFRKPVRAPRTYIPQIKDSPVLLLPVRVRRDRSRAELRSVRPVGRRYCAPGTATRRLAWASVPAVTDTPWTRDTGLPGIPPLSETVSPYRLQALHPRVSNAKQ